MPDNFDNGNPWQNNFGKTYNQNFNEGWFTTTNAQTVANPNTAVPYATAPPAADTLIAGVIPGTDAPPFVAVAHSESATNSTSTTNAVRTESNEWWKWWFLAGALMLLLAVGLLALCCGPKTRIRQPVKKVEEEVPIMVEERVQIAPKQVVVEEKVYKPVKKQVVIEKKPVKRVEEKVMVKEKIGFNPYKQKSVDFRL